MTDRIPDAARIHSPTKTRDGITILDIEHYAPFLLNAISNSWQRKTSPVYRERFGIGITEWRVMSMLNIEPEISAHRICEVIKMDKAAVSRSLKILDDLGYLRFDSAPNDPRKRRWSLADEGLRVHNEIMAVALESEEDMVQGLTPDQLDSFLKTLRQILANFD
ncbi:winged helix-turn-helix transcriptional regulator [Paracoccus sp. M683]|uniref:MarR family winged helix-turn-helix transcriptional regulator n=1 Tax=Paracoccus sp. M683 TaxID=2594268 RepID=UPI00117D784A|nr:MarR family winged helix-turn-helix transcriptional regulator [Paracoccus sp. M683]TRW95333.1 winged helix-turn-helix transcriptional regulator [Paracoccus sp. M683]